MQTESVNVRLSNEFSCKFNLVCFQKCKHGPECPHKKCLSLCIDCGFAAFMAVTEIDPILPSLPREIYASIYKILIDLQHRDDKAAKERAIDRDWQQKTHRMAEWRKGNYVD